jgi:hypothetical protein
VIVTRLREDPLAGRAVQFASCIRGAA